MGRHGSRHLLHPRQSGVRDDDGAPGPEPSDASSSSVSSSSVSSSSRTSSSVSISLTSVSRSTSSDSSSSSTSTSRSSSSFKSSSSSSSLSSSSSSTSSSVLTSQRILVSQLPNSTPTPTPTTTLFFAPLPTSETSVPTEGIEPSTTPPPSQNNVGAVSGFWGNKSAVGGVFTVVGLIVVGILAFIVLVIRKKRRKGPSSFSDSAYDRFAEPAMQYSARTPSPGPSTAEMHQASPLEVQDSYSDLFYNNQEPPMQPYDYSAYAQPSFPPQSSDYHSSNNYAYSANDILPSPVPAPVAVRQRAPQQLPPPSHNLPASLFTSPAKNNYASAISTGKLAPVSAPVARDSYQPSIDSFYGGAGNAPASGKSNDPFL